VPRLEPQTIYLMYLMNGLDDCRCIYELHMTCREWCRMVDGLSGLIGLQEPQLGWMMHKGKST